MIIAERDKNPQAGAKYSHIFGNGKFYPRKGNYMFFTVEFSGF